MNFLNKTPIVFLTTFMLFVGVNVLLAQWIAPGGAPSAGNNRPSPINTSATNQVKSGGLSVGGLTVTGKMYIQGSAPSPSPSGVVDLEVGGSIGARSFCDPSGTSCFSTQQIVTAIQNSQSFSTYTRFAKDFYAGARGWGSSPYRVSTAKAVCNAGDYAIKGRGYGGGFGTSMTTGAAITLYNQLNTAWLDANNIGWGPANNSQWHKVIGWNNTAWLDKKGSVAASEVQCLHIN